MKRTLVTGGGRSGKSRRALELALPREAKAFIATAEALDDEMRARIEKHREDRGEEFLTVEEPFDLARAVRSLPGEIEVAVIDCLTVWLGNLVHRHEGEARAFAEVPAFVELVRDPPCDLIMVTNEVGMGIIPANELARRFRDLAGTVNQAVAALADEVVLMVSGVPVVIKRAQAPADRSGRPARGTGGEQN
ncbi:MAG: bifunctional adenosylcobinamide kinase/adenosylcobinamide-phosphate guanylyltransferase [Planctomycetota bacterium]|jgi:adenosylcobinamide kinase/adenosylcobinamide-phosphate guanylyltransferase